MTPGPLLIQTRNRQRKRGDPKFVTLRTSNNFANYLSEVFHLLKLNGEELS